MKKISPPLLDVLERAGKSGVQQFLVVAYASTSGVHAVSSLPWYGAVSTGLGAALLSVLASLASWRVPVLPFWLDLLVRMGKTFVESLLVTLGAGVINLFEVDWIHAVNLGLGAAFLSLLTGLMSAGVVSANSAGGPSASLVYASPVQEAVATEKPMLGSIELSNPMQAAVFAEPYDPKHDIEEEGDPHLDVPVSTPVIDGKGANTGTGSVKDLTSPPFA